MRQHGGIVLGLRPTLPYKLIERSNRHPEALRLLNASLLVGDLAQLSERGYRRFFVASGDSQRAIGRLGRQAAPYAIYTGLRGSPALVYLFSLLLSDPRLALFGAHCLSRHVIYLLRLPFSDDPGMS